MKAFPLFVSQRRCQPESDFLHAAHTLLALSTGARPLCLLTTRQESRARLRATWQPDYQAVPQPLRCHLYNGAEFLILPRPQLRSSNSYSDRQPWSQAAPLLSPQVAEVMGSYVHTEMQKTCGFCLDTPSLTRLLYRKSVLMLYSTLGAALWERLSEQGLMLPATSQWEPESCQQVLLTASEWAWNWSSPGARRCSLGRPGARETQLSRVSAQIPAP